MTDAGDERAEGEGDRQAGVPEPILRARHDQILERIRKLGQRLGAVVLEPSETPPREPPGRDRNDARHAG